MQKYYKKGRKLNSLVLSCILSISTVYVNTDSINAKDIDILEDQQITISDEQYSSNIKDIKLIKNQLIKGESLDIVVNLITKEDKNDNLILEYKNKNSKSSIHLECKYDEENNRYIGNTIINNNAMEGEWKISSIYKVKADSSTQYLEINNEWIENTKFYIVKNKVIKFTKEQIEKPKIEYISLDKREAKAGETINIDVKFKEGKLKSGDYIGVSYSIENDRGSYAYVTGLYYDASKNVYKGSLDIHDGMPYGTYKLNNIEIISYETGDIIYISNEDYDFSKYDIQLNTKWDTEGPKLISVEVDKKEAIPGDTVKITVDAKDEIGKVENITVNFDQQGYYYSSYLQYNEESQKFVGKLNITNKYLNGKLSIDNIYLRDTNWNTTHITKDMYDFSSCDVNIKESLEDREGPELLSIGVDKKEVNPGDTVKITVYAKDDRGNVEYGYLYIMDANGKSHYVSLQKEDATDRLVGSLYITNNYPNGKLSIKNVDLYDSNGNSTYISNSDYDFSNCEIEVKGSLEDFEGPKLLSVEVDKKEVNPGDTVKITVYAKDEIANVQGGSLHIMDAKGESHYVSLQKEEATDRLVGSLYITNNYPNGKLSIKNVDLYDSNGNSTYISNSDYDFSSCEIEVKNSKEDFEGPELISIEVDKKEVNPGDTVKITVDAKDVEYGYLYIMDANGKSHYVSLQKEDATDKLVGSLYITNKYPNGKLSIKNVDLYDSNGNSTYISNSDYDFSSCEIEVKESLEDFEGPELISVDIDKKEVKQGESFKVSVKAKDKVSDIDSVYVHLYYEDNEYGYRLDLEYSEKNDAWEAEMYVGNWMEEGNLYIDSITLTDINGNYTYKDENNYDFSDKYVVIPEMDNEAPEVKNIILENNTQNGEGKVKISVDLEDKNKIQYAELAYANYSSERFKYINLSLNKDSGLYEGYIYFFDFDESGIWSIDHIYVSDEFGNSTYISNYEYDFSKNDIELSGTIGVDNTPPEINSIITDKDKATKGESIKVSIDALDDKSGVKNAVAIYKNVSTPHKKVVNLDYNKSIEKLEGYLNILDEDDSGVYQLESIYIEDNQWNGQFYYNLKSSIEIYGTEGIDYNAPEFISVSVDKNNINIGETVKFTIKSEDDKSGVKKADIRLYNAEINKYKWINCNYNSSSGLYEGVLNISSDMVGQWKITNIYLEDNGYNWTYVYSDKYNFNNCILTILSQKNNEEAIEVKEQIEENQESAIELIEQHEEI